MARTGLDSLAAELAGETAQSLGRAGARLQAALDALAAHDAAPTEPAVRVDLVDDAAEQAWGFIVLRAALGWYDEREALDAYRVPAEVRARMGARRRNAAPGAGPGSATPDGGHHGPPYR